MFDYKQTNKRLWHKSDYKQTNKRLWHMSDYKPTNFHKAVMKYLSEQGEATGCSTNTVLIKSSIHWVSNDLTFLTPSSLNGFKIAT